MLVSSSLAAAQSISDRGWVVFRQPDGLSTNDTYSILVHDDTVWVGTATGVSRYDGRWQNFAMAKAGDGAGSPDVELGRVSALAHDGLHDEVWAGTASGLLARWGGDGAWTIVHVLSESITALTVLDDMVLVGTDAGLFIWQDDALRSVPKTAAASISAMSMIDGDAWIAAEDAVYRLQSTRSDIDLYHPKDVDGNTLSGPFTGVWAQSPNHLWLSDATTVYEHFIDSGETESYAPFVGANSIGVTDIEGVNQDSVWVASNGSGVAQYRLAGREIVSMRSWGGSTQGGLNTDTVRDIEIDSSGSVWFATPIGVFRYQPWAFQDVDERTESLQVQDLLFDRGGGLWAATAGEGVQYWSDRYRQPDSFLQYNSGLPGNFVYDLEQDLEGRIWAATDQGVAYYENSLWRTPASLQMLEATPVSAATADDLGVWLATNDGVVRYRTEDGSARFEPFTQGHPIAALCADSIGRLWVAAADGALWTRNVDGKWAEMPTLDVGSNGPVQVTALYPLVDPPGAVLAAFKGFGIYRYDGSAWQAVSLGKKTVGDRVFAILPNPATDSIWIGSETGLSQIDAYGGATYDSQDGMQPGAVRAIVQDSLGAFWFGGDRGLSYYVPENSTPWIRLDNVRGGEVTTRDGVLEVFAGEPVEFAFAFGDIEAHTSKLRAFARLVTDDVAQAWQPLESEVFQDAFPAGGDLALEYMVRDQALNYSDIQSVQVRAVAAPAYTNVPLLGKVESRIFHLLVLFGSLAVFGFGYVSYEILQHRQRVTEAVARGYNPYISGEPVRREDMFFGRHELLQRIVSTLHSNSIMIHGERRIGKTTLLYQLANTLRQISDPEYWFVALYVDLEGTTETRFFYLLMDEIVQHVRALELLTAEETQRLERLSYHTTAEEEYTDHDFSRDLRHVMHVLDQYCARCNPGKQVRLILLMDEMDTLSRFDHLVQQQLRRIFMRDFAASLGAVVAGIEINKDWERVESPWFNLFNEIAMQPFTYEQSVQLLVDPVRGYYIYEPDAVEFILEQSDGRPYRLQQYGMEAVNEMLRHKRRRITMHDVVTAHAIIQWSGQAEGIRADGSGPDTRTLTVVSTGAA